MKTFYFLLLITVLFITFGTTSISANHFSFDQDRLNSITDDIEQLLKQADELFKQGKFDEALEVLKKAAELSPQDFRPKAIAGIIYLSQFKLAQAVEEFDKAIALNPNNKYLYLYKARADYFQNKREESLASSQKALKLDPSFVDAYLMVGDILRYMKGREAEAMEAYRTALKLNPNVLQAYVSQAQLLEYEKNEKEAEEMYRKAMSIDPDKMAGRFNLGRLLVNQGRLKEARQLWEEKTSDKDNTFPNFITVLERAENLEKAKEALAEKPNDPEILLQMGYAVMDGDHWVVDGRQKRAIEYFRKALEIKPDFAKAQLAIVKAYIQIADTYEKENPNVDKELAKLKKMNTEMAKEMEEYRKNYSGGFKVAGPPPPPAAPPPPSKN